MLLLLLLLLLQIGSVSGSHGSRALNLRLRLSLLWWSLLLVHRLGWLLLLWLLLEAV